MAKIQKISHISTYINHLLATLHASLIRIQGRTCGLRAHLYPFHTLLYYRAHMSPASSHIRKRHDFLTQTHRQNHSMACTATCQATAGNEHYSASSWPNEKTPDSIYCP